MPEKYEIYKCAPLVEAVFEIRFAGEPAIECRRDEFFDEIRNEYPIFKVPIARAGVALPLEPYRFERENGTYSIGISVNKLFISCKKYEGYQVFKKEIVRVLTIFNKIFDRIDKIKRTGLRYINIIPFTREKGIIPIDSYINLRISLPESIPTVFKNLSVGFVSQTDGGSITTRIEPVVSPDNHEAILLDFDYAKEGELRFNSIDSYLDESHSHTKHLFEELITDEYIKVMRGEVI